MNPQTPPLLLAPLLLALQGCPSPSSNDDTRYGCGTGEYEPELHMEIGEMIAVPAGSFTMGGPGDESKAEPEHTVTLTHAYELGRAEITNAQLATMLNIALERGLLAGDYAGGVTVTNADGSERELVNMDGAGTQGDNQSRIEFDGERFVVQQGWEQHPANWLTWFGAAMYCNLLSEQEGLEPMYDPSDWSALTYEADGYRLPTEAEWERAARYDDGRSWPWGDAPEPSAELANYDFQVDHTSEVCGYPDGASALGYCDLAGNVLEWTQDRHSDYSEDAATDPIGENSDGRRVLRGGSWNHEVDRLLTWDRYYDPLPSESYGGIGFRIARITD